MQKRGDWERTCQGTKYLAESVKGTGRLGDCKKGEGMAAAVAVAGKSMQ
jgi:hypothetical protein